MPTPTRISRLLLAATVLVACAPVANPTTTTAPASTTTDAVTSTTPASTTTTAAGTTTTTLDDGSRVLPAATDEMPGGWTEALFIPYGEGPDTLGTSLGGDGEGIQIGPEYGAQGPDGTWWFLDGARLRLAQFSPEGEFLAEAILDEDLLAQGMYFQYQLPRVLDNGMLVANRLAGETTLMLRARGEEVDLVSVEGNFIPRTDDGVSIYGFEISDSNALMEVDPNTGETTAVEWFRTRAGTRFSLTVDRGQLRVEMPDSGTDLTVPIVAGEVGGNAFFSLEAASDIDGNLYLFLVGAAEADESLQLAGFLTVSSTGELGPMEPMRNPYTSADPGSPAHLGVRPQSNDVWMMFVDEDGVRVYSRD